MSPIKTSAIVLKSINWKDSSKIVSLYTREHGRINVIAKGARRSNSQYQGILESVNLIEVTVYISPNRQLQILGQASVEESYPKIRLDFEKTAYTFAILELVDIFFQQTSADIIFFDFMQNLLMEMQIIENPQIVFWYFLLKLSSYLGFRPDFETCYKCSTKITSEEVLFLIHKGSVICNNCSSGTPKTWRLTYSARTSLRDLQKANHKSLSSLSIELAPKFPYLDFLLNYLRYHSEEKLELSALKLLN